MTNSGLMRARFCRAWAAARLPVLLNMASSTGCIMLCTKHPPHHAGWETLEQLHELHLDTEDDRGAERGTRDTQVISVCALDIEVQEASQKNYDEYRHSVIVLLPRSTESGLNRALMLDVIRFFIQPLRVRQEFVVYDVFLRNKPQRVRLRLVHDTNSKSLASPS
ncbi:hypothetical protein EYF80_023062 [Liparis tanakae]|uniref:Hexosyltransferase n=1 Tax=Liparis tanakae TaxID=230148 RepID=A0A4Z2HNV8_9TELE|nr:hypothetical protein EYF80_023062 [Liparis tanakae]